MSSYQDMEDEIDDLLKDKRKLTAENRALHVDINDNTRWAKESKVWLSLYSNLLINYSADFGGNSITLACWADEALKEYKKRYGKDE